MDGDVHALLKSHGDRFLAMFDDAEERPAIADQEAGSPSSEQDTPSTSESESGEDEAPQRWTGAADKVLPTPRQPQVKAAPPRPFVEDRERYKAERRAFMSGRIGGPRNTPQPGTQRREPGAESAVDPRSRAEFAQIQRDVLELGATGLDKKARKQYEAVSLVRLGAKAEKGPRIPASIGIGMARKRAQREARATEEAIAAGMLSVRSLAKKRRRESSAARPRDQGLQEDGGSFRAGVMRVSRPPPPSAKRGGRR
uniref:Uncharacterized protein n=1 Tax=Auxenochlorella protothecoides TaxID=3075 RepID=A0A1D1ZVH6_AUXPR